MNMKDAWNSAVHGEAIVNASSGTRIEKWIGDKPGLSPSFDRFIESNVSNISTEDIVSSDWIVENQ